MKYGHVYEWDAETGGLLLTTSELKMSKEPRPVYSQELDILGFNKYWLYPKNDDVPLMWAEGNNYIYRGRVVAQTKGGSPFEAPQIVLLDDPEAKGVYLRQVDIEEMLLRNASIIEQCTNETIKYIRNIHDKYKKKVDVFYVAFSGGKDSILVLDLVQKALGHNEFMVLFGDTQMEFPDTYQLINQVKAYCTKNGIRFLTAKSNLAPKYTWREFGPPAQKIRWCCSVHKSAPQILLLRKEMKNSQFRGMAFTGIRAAESANRAEYDDVSLGEKIRGQYSCHPILEWHTAELFLYTFANHLPINKAYVKGNSRAGCLVCPLAGYKNMWLKEQLYSKSSVEGSPTTTLFNNIILETSSKDFPSEEARKEFMNIAGWKARRSGKELSFAKSFMEDEQDDSSLTVRLSRLRTSWREWMKTLGKLEFVDDSHVRLIWDGNVYPIVISENNGETKFTLKVGNTKSEILLKKAFKIVLRKAAYCIGCQVCEANCPYGCISMKSGNIHISEKCIHCRKCHEIDNGCLVASSNKVPKKINNMGSINRYGNMGVEFDWIRQYFNLKDEEKPKLLGPESNLGSKMVRNLSYFLNDSGITVKKQFSPFGYLIAKMGIENSNTWALVLCNLAYTAQFNWWIKNIEFGCVYTTEMILDLIQGETETSKPHIPSAFKNILISNSVLSKEVGLGNCDYQLKNGKRFLQGVQRVPWSDPDEKVILYSLYKFAEACGDYKQFTLSRLMDTDIESDGITPVQLFGLDKETLSTLLKGLSANYPDFINVTFTLNLDNITLRDDKTSKDVLTLF